MSQFHNTTRWHNLARWIKDRDSRRCKKCGKSGRLEADHVIPVNQLTDEQRRGGAEYDPANIQALCRNCHFEKTHKERQSALRSLKPKAVAWSKLVDKLRL